MITLVPFRFVVFSLVLATAAFYGGLPLFVGVAIVAALLLSAAR